MSQSLAKLYVHLVFSTKGRTDTIPKAHLAEIHAYIAEVLNQHHAPALCVGGTANHVHILFVLNKSLSIGDVVRIVKSNSSRFINERNGIYNPFCWQNGYGAFSISQSHIPGVMQYIEGQEGHHAAIDYKEEFRRLCSIYKIDIDERYVWD